MSAPHPPSRRSSPVKSGKSTRSKASSKSVRKLRARSTPLSMTGTIDGEKKPDGPVEFVDDNGLLHLDMKKLGLAHISTSVLKSNLATLDVSGNNIRVLPAHLATLHHLTRLCISKNNIRCTNAYDYGGVPMEISNLKNLKELDVSDCNLKYIPPAIWRLPNLTYLNISRNKINMLVPEVGNMIKLQHLNVQFDHLSTLPPEIAFCQDLEVILLLGNVIDSLPDTLRELPNLHTLSLNYQSFSSIYDTYMYNLLQKGQIQSEHIPPVVFHIPRLKTLNLEATKINTLPENCNANLQELYLQRNFLVRIPGCVLSGESLIILDMSNNLLTSLPEDLSQLKALKVLKVDNNKVEAIPKGIDHLTSLTYFSIGSNNIAVIPSQIGNLSMLKTLILSCNRITELPEAIIKLTKLETLDLASNQITSLPICFHKMVSLERAHIYDKFTRVGLWLHKNPITMPPPDIWKTEDPSHVYDYLRKLEILHTHNLQRQKLIVLGAEQSGKTSLLTTMITRTSHLTNSLEDSTKMANYTTWRTDNDVPFTVLELGGHKVYNTTHPMFLDPTSIYLLVYDHRQYTCRTHQAEIGYWLTLLQVYAPGAVIKIVGSQIDKISPSISDTTLEVVQDNVNKQMQDMDEQLENTIQLVDDVLAKGSKPDEIIQHFEKQRLRLEELRANPLRIHGEIKLVTSKHGMSAIRELIEELEYLAVDTKLRPRAQRNIPKSWYKYLRALKLSDGHCLNWEEVTIMAKDNDMQGTEMEECVQFLSETGEILWFQNIPDLKRTIFHKPHALLKILNAIFRNDFHTFLNFTKNRVLASNGQFSEKSFEVAKEALLQRGQVSRPMIQCLWFYLDIDYDKFNLLCELIPKFDICYLVPQPEMPARRHKFRQLLGIPSYNVVPHQDGDLWVDKCSDDIFELKVIITFPINYPEGLFERLANRIQSFVYSRIDWQDLIWAEAESGDGKIVTEMLLHRSLDEINFSPMLTMTVRSRILEEGTQLMTKLCTNLQILLVDYPGMVWFVELCTMNCNEVTLADTLSTLII